MINPERDARIKVYHLKAQEIRLRAEQMSNGEEKKASLKVADGYDAMVMRLKQANGPLTKV